jgi:hypothetical protein
MKKRGTLIFLLVLLLTSGAYAISVTPSKTITYFSGDSISENLYLSLKNTNRFGVLGEMSINSHNFPEEYLNFDIYDLEFQPNEIKEFNFLLNIPEKFSQPGDYRFDIIVKEIENNTGSESATITVRTAVGGVFIVRVPHDGYFLGTKLEAKGTSVGELVPFVLTLENLGTLDIENIQGSLEIFDNENNSVGEIPFTHTLPINSIHQVELNWDTSGGFFGNYWAKVTLDYEGKTSIAETTFKLGDVHVSIVDFDKSIKSGDINRFKVKLKSDWGNYIDGAFMTLAMESDFPGFFKSENFDLKPWEEKDVTLYVDAVGINKGEYPALLSVNYGDIYTEEKFSLRVTSFNYLSIIIGVGIFIVVFSIGYFILWKIQKKKIKNENK